MIKEYLNASRQVELLEQRGIAPLKMSPFTKRLLESRPDTNQGKKEEK